MTNFHLMLYASILELIKNTAFKSNLEWNWLFLFKFALEMLPKMHRKTPAKKLSFRVVIFKHILREYDRSMTCWTYLGCKRSFNILSKSRWGNAEIVAHICCGRCFGSLLFLIFMSLKTKQTNRKRNKEERRLWIEG